MRTVAAIARARRCRLPRVGCDDGGGLQLQRAPRPRPPAALGLRAIVYLEVFGSEPEEVLRDAFERNRERIAEPYESDLVRLGVSPHAPYSVLAQTPIARARRSGSRSRRTSRRARAEVRYLRNGKRPVAGPRLPRRAAGDDRAASARRRGPARPVGPAVHCVQVEPDEIELLARHGVGVAHCPRSNAMLGCGVAPVAALRAAGRPGRSRHRQPRLDSVLRHVRRDAGRRHARPHGVRGRRRA